MKFFITLFVLGIILSACTAPPEPTPDLPATVTALVTARLADIPTATPQPTSTPYPTFTPYPTPTPVPTATPYPTYTPLPTLAPLPTYTPYPTATRYPTSTPRPTYTPYPTLRALPTSTPRPTYTPYPRPTAMPTPRVPRDRVIRVDALNTANGFWLDRRPMVLVGCNADLAANKDRGVDWYTFSWDGHFAKGIFLAQVTGFESKPLTGSCYEMLVRYDGVTGQCFYTSRPGDIWLSELGCRGWQQQTPEFFLVSPDAAQHISRQEWREKHVALP